MGSCSIDGCQKPVKARRWCAAHYKAWEKYGDPLVNKAKRAVVAPCVVEGCGKTAQTRGMCAAHYKAWLRHGDPTLRKNNSVRRPCAVAGCEALTTREYCNAHEIRLRRYGDATFKPPKISDGFCTIEGCGRRAHTGQLCRSHYARSRRAEGTAARPGLPVMLTESQLLFIQQSRGLIRHEDLAAGLNTDVHTVIAVQAGRNWGRTLAR